MKVRLIRECQLFEWSPSITPAGKIVDVTKDFGQQLIEEGNAVATTQYNPDDILLAKHFKEQEISEGGEVKPQGKRRRRGASKPAK